MLVAQQSWVLVVTLVLFFPNFCVVLAKVLLVKKSSLIPNLVKPSNTAFSMLIVAYLLQ